jgi:hypothetical protein
MKVQRTAGGYVSRPAWGNNEKGRGGFLSCVLLLGYVREVRGGSKT